MTQQTMPLKTSVTRYINFRYNHYSDCYVDDAPVLIPWYYSPSSQLSPCLWGIEPGEAVLILIDSSTDVHRFRTCCKTLRTTVTDQLHILVYNSSPTQPVGVFEKTTLAAILEHPTIEHYMIVTTSAELNWMRKNLEFKQIIEQGMYSHNLEHWNFCEKEKRRADLQLTLPLPSTGDLSKNERSTLDLSTLDLSTLDLTKLDLSKSDLETLKPDQEQKDGSGHGGLFSDESNDNDNDDVENNKNFSYTGSIQKMWKGCTPSTWFELMCGNPKPSLESQPVSKQILSTVKTEQQLNNTDIKYPLATLSDQQRRNHQPSNNTLDIPLHEELNINSGRGKENIPPKHV